MSHALPDVPMQPVNVKSCAWEGDDDWATDRNGNVTIDGGARRAGGHQREEVAAPAQGRNGDRAGGPSGHVVPWTRHSDS